MSINTQQGTDTLTPSTGGLNIAGNLKLGTAGNKLSIKGGSNAAAGKVTLVAGLATVNTTAVTAQSIVLMTPNGGSTSNLGFLCISSITPGTSFTITSSNILDNSDIGWVLLDIT